MLFLETVNGLDQMKINDIILEATLSPDEKAQQQKMANAEYNRIMQLKIPDAKQFATDFMKAFGLYGTVDSAYQQAVAMSKERESKLKARQEKDAELKGKKRSSMYVSAKRSGPEPTSRQPISVSGGGSGVGRGKYTVHKDGSARAGSGKFQQGMSAVGKFIQDLPGGKTLSRAGKALAKGVEPITKAVDTGRKGYDFFRDPDAFQKFKNTRIKRR